MPDNSATKSVALITGASRGIGAATARRLAAAGYAVAVNYRARADAAAALVDELQAHGTDAVALQADVSDERQVADLFHAVDERWSRLDALVNNAGILEKQCSVEDITVDRFQRILNVNVIGTFLCCRAAIERMTSGAAIVNLSSMAARLGSPHAYADYAASKAAVDTFSIGLAKELAPRGIRVNVVRPGIIDTEIHADGGEPNRVQRLAPSVPLGRGGTPDEVAHAIYWLLSDQSSFTTGTFIDVAGGI